MPVQDYEIMIIFSPVLSQQDYQKQQKNYLKMITGEKGVIVHSTSWGLRSMAYPIEKKTTGLYFIVEFQAKPSFVHSLKTSLKRDETVLREMIVKLDKHAVAYNLKKRNSDKAVSSEEPNIDYNKA